METHDCFETTEPKPLNMVDINDDCKEFIFEYLDLADLVNIAETSKQLKKAVCTLFKRRYGKEKLAFGESYVQAHFPSENKRFNVNLFF